MGDNISSNNIITDADRLCDDILIYNNEWDMERCNSLYRVNWKKWYISYNNDAEWIYMRSRMEYMNKLLIAYENTFEKKYLKKWDYIFKSLIKYVVMGSGIFCDRFTQRHYVKLLARVPFMKKYYELNRKLDVAIRNFVLCDRLNINLPESKYKNRIIKLIRQNSTYIVNTFNEWDQTSNWGLIAIFSVIYSQCVIKEFADIKKYESLIEVMLNKQFYKDYSHIECSPMYTVQIHLSMLRVLYRFEDILSDRKSVV